MMTFAKNCCADSGVLTALVVSALVLAACSNQQPGVVGGAVPVPVAAVKAVEVGQADQGTPVPSCHIDSLSVRDRKAVAGTPFSVPHETGLNVAGWVGTPDGAVVPAYVSFRLLGDGGHLWEFTVPTGGARGDVAQYMGKPALATSGFSLIADLSNLKPGTYHAYLAFEHEGKAFSCNGGDSIVVQ